MKRKKPPGAVVLSCSGNKNRKAPALITHSEMKLLIEVFEAHHVAVTPGLLRTDFGKHG